MALPERIQKILSKYNLDSGAVWEVRGGNYAIYHKAVERIQAIEKISFDPPEIIHDGHNEKNEIVLRITGRLGDRSEWSFGECAPNNNKNAYPWAMAEKRAKDRVVLKLIDTHGDLFSDSEADDLAQSAEPSAPKQSAYAMKKNGEWERFMEKLEGFSDGDLCQTWFFKNARPHMVASGWPDKWLAEADEEVAKHCSYLMDKKASVA